MNYLAHLFLAEPTPESRLGNLLGDFAPGRPELLPWPDAIVRGIIRHRAIDRFTDLHPVTRKLKALIDPGRKRFAGVIVDLLHDHFLTRHWERFSDQPLDRFIDDCNSILTHHRRILPAELGDTLDDRIADDWLGRYGTDAGMDAVFHLVSLRKPRFRPMRHAIDDLRRHRAELEAGFLDFFPDLRRWVREQGPESQLVIDRPETPR